MSGNILLLQRLFSYGKTLIRLPCWQQCTDHFCSSGFATQPTYPISPRALHLFSRCRVRMFSHLNKIFLTSFSRLSRSSVAFSSLRIGKLYGKSLLIFTWISISTYIIAGVVLGSLSALLCAVQPACETAATCLCHPPHLLLIVSLLSEFMFSFSYFTFSNPQSLILVELAIDFGLAFRNWHMIHSIHKSAFACREMRLPRHTLLITLSSNLLIFFISLIFTVRYTVSLNKDPMQLIYLVNSTVSCHTSFPYATFDDICSGYRICLHLQHSFHWRVYCPHPQALFTSAVIG